MLFAANVFVVVNGDIAGANSACIIKKNTIAFQLPYV